MDLSALTMFMAVAEERSFSRAAAKLNRAQPTVSLAVRRLERSVGQKLFDRSSKAPTLTDAGQVMITYGERLAKLVNEAESAMREVHDLRRGRITIGSNEAAVHIVLPLIFGFQHKHPKIVVEVRRVPTRQIAVEVRQGSLDFGVMTFRPEESGLMTVSIGADELVLLVPPTHRLAARRRITMDDVSAERIIAHNDPSPARERVLRLFEDKQVPLNTMIELPSLDGIKRAVEIGIGVALLPRRCAFTEITDGRLVALPVAELSRRREVKLVCRPSARSNAAEAFLAVARELAPAVGRAPVKAHKPSIA